MESNIKIYSSSTFYSFKLDLGTKRGAARRVSVGERDEGPCLRRPPPSVRRRQCLSPLFLFLPLSLMGPNGESEDPARSAHRGRRVRRRRRQGRPFCLGPTDYCRVVHRPLALPLRCVSTSPFV